jgi:hypothetical protein
MFFCVNHHTQNLVIYRTRTKPRYLTILTIEYKMAPRLESVALQAVILIYCLLLLSSAFPSSPQRGYSAGSIRASSLFRANTELKMSSQGSAPQQQEEEQYPMNPFDAYPESATDDEILEDLRMQNQIANDLWQSTHFRDNHEGDWIGQLYLSL